MSEEEISAAISAQSVVELYKVNAAFRQIIVPKLMEADAELAKEGGKSKSAAPKAEKKEKKAEKKEEKKGEKKEKKDEKSKAKK